MGARKTICAVLCALLLVATLTGCRESMVELRQFREQMKFEQQVTEQWREEQLDEGMVISDMEKPEVTEAVLAAFSERDAESLKAMLCRRTREMDDIDAQIQRAFDFFEGSVVSYDDNLSGSEGESRDYGVDTTHDRRWFVRDIQTDAGGAYDITVNQYLLSVNLPGREGIVQLNIGNDRGEEVVIGYEWTYYSAVAKSEVRPVFDSVYEGSLSTMYCERTRELPDVKEQMVAAAHFIEGVPDYGEGRSGIWDPRVRIVQEEEAENHEASRVYLEIYAENIRTDAERVYSMEVYMYFVNTVDETLHGVMKVVIYDEEGNSCVIGENFHDA